MKEITHSDFDSEVINCNNNVIVDFWAPWCSPCKAMAPILAEIESQGKCRIVKVHAGNEQQLVTRFGISGLPTLLFFAGGKEVGRHTGMLAKPALLAKIASFLK